MHADLRHSAAAPTSRGTLRALADRALGGGRWLLPRPCSYFGGQSKKSPALSASHALRKEARTGRTCLFGANLVHTTWSKLWKRACNMAPKVALPLAASAPEASIRTAPRCLVALPPVSRPDTLGPYLLARKQAPSIADTEHCSRESVDRKATQSAQMSCPVSSAEHTVVL